MVPSCQISIYCFDNFFPHPKCSLVQVFFSALSDRNTKEKTFRCITLYVMLQNVRTILTPFLDLYDLHGNQMPISGICPLSGCPMSRLTQIAP
jgi:hypothetical protein